DLPTGDVAAGRVIPSASDLFIRDRFGGESRSFLRFVTVVTELSQVTFQDLLADGNGNAAAAQNTRNLCEKIVVDFLAIERSGRKFFGQIGIAANQLGFHTGGP